MHIVTEREPFSITSTPLYSQFIHLSRYSRWLDDKNRRETWRETVQRYIDFFKGRHPDLADEIQALFLPIYELEVMPSMRAIMTAGKALERDNFALYNCSFAAVDHPRVFDEILYILCCGTGAGFSVERQFVSKLPDVAEDFHESATCISVADSKIGWATAFRELISLLYAGQIPSWDLSKIRPHGARLKTMGGRASGKDPLDKLFKFTVSLFKRAAGRKLSSIECHDLVCMIGDIVVVGGVRRSALVSLSNLSDDRMRLAKSGQWWVETPYRALANNSAAYTEKPEFAVFLKELESLYESKSGERGIFNRKSAQRQSSKSGRRDASKVIGTNPCVTGETLVYVADGRGHVRIDELAAAGVDVPVFCMDGSSNVTIRTMRNPRVTGHDVDVYMVTLDDGSTVTATANHKFRLTSGKYSEVKDLKYGDSLKVITKFEASIKDLWPDTHSRSQDYYWLNNGKSSNYAEHRLIAKFHYNSDVPDGHVVHHIDRNAQNNIPDNLRVMSKEDHDRLHGDLMRGDNNPMRRAKTEWTEDQWSSYRSKQSELNSGENNSNFSGFTDEELKAHSLVLTKSMGARFAIADWQEYASTRGLPKYFSKWRKDHLGGILGLAKWAALQLGYEHVDVDPRVVRTYEKYTSQGYNCSVVDGKVVVHKICEVCSTPFTSLTSCRESGVCSASCAQRGRTADATARAAAGMRAYHANRHISVRDNQAKVYSDLKFRLGREPQKKEWIASCLAVGCSHEISRVSSPFRKYNDLKSYAADYNHKVVSVEYVGTSDVYNGTVDEFHNFFVGGFHSLTSNEKNKYTYLNNLQCGEILLRTAGACNLSEVIIRPSDTLDDLASKIKLATILGTLQSSISDLRYVRRVWQTNMEEERLLGVSLTGITDHPVLGHHDNADLPDILEALKQVAISTNKEWAAKLGINVSAAISCVKPSGTISQLTDTASGIHPRFSKYYIRRVRADNKDPLAKMMRDWGFPCEDDVTNPAVWIFSFPMKSPDTAQLASDVTAMDQLKLWKIYHDHWCEHNPSITVYYRDHEFLEVGNWVWNNFDDISGIAFLPYSDHTYVQSPYEAITEQQYLDMLKLVPKEVDWTHLVNYENTDNTIGSQTLACSGSSSCDVTDLIR